jgi:orotidine-5'-phosphate decarboxylase
MIEIESCACVGLDLAFDRIPETFHKSDDEKTLRVFGRHIIDLTAQYAAVFKANIAFFESRGWRGLRALEYLREYAARKGVPFILDCKRGDIGRTAAEYAQMAFGVYEADAVTLPPYLSSDSVFEFLKRGFAFILVRTTNKSARDLQDLVIDDSDKRKLFLHVASMVDGWRGQYPECGVVAGGTYPQDIPDICDITGDAPVLIPGVGTQGASLSEVVEAVTWNKVAGRPFIINSSSKIDFAPDPAEAAKHLRNNINKLLPDRFYRA